MNPVLLVALFVTVLSLRVENEYYSKGTGSVSSVGVNKDFYLYSAEEGLLTKVDFQGNMGWRRHIEKGGKHVTVGPQQVFVVYENHVTSFDQKGEMEYQISVSGTWSIYTNNLEVLVGDEVFKYATRDGSLLSKVSVNNLDKPVDEYFLQKDTKCSAMNDRFCLIIEDGKVLITNRIGELVKEIDGTQIVSTLFSRGIPCFIRKSGKVYAVFNNEEILIKKVNGSGHYFLFTTYDASEYSEEIVTPELLSKEMGVVDYNGKVFLQNESEIGKVKLCKTIPGGFVAILENNKIFTIGKNVIGSYVIGDQEVYKISADGAIVIRNYDHENVFKVHSEEVVGNVGKATSDRGVKIPFSLKSVSAVVSHTKINVIEMISGKILESVNLPETAEKTRCVVFQGFVICFVKVQKNTQILSIELFEETVDWKAESYDVFNLPKISTIVKTTNLPYSVDLATVTVSTLGIANKMVLVYSEGQLYVINPKTLTGTKAPFEMVKQDQEMGEVPYVATLNITKDDFILKGIDLDVNRVETHPGELESATYVMASGNDFYFSQITPLLSFDSTYNFNKPQLFITTVVVLALTVILYFVNKKRGMSDVALAQKKLTEMQKTN
ncbi:hypothetical protein EIN_469430 [Entamoeba invadens IP1]|uniref:ER membrane protein complex subunit 1 n=1 Tax=Entamoeba invadens IP1 TaxID=370355 RepID=A0A0A1TUL9_ENTIV|nr:hypothetical protein EIN_469430 [Entamoeba invadens IP1]ELP83739.1 hypothetical protein EIN_469430 [Entamoeba invadens IP1]|eukprot:XP_004183085.1 hypothetical protein EIN_469430 [Entamoeba invadens IP1]